jgi:hypothetical protein
VCAVEQGQLAAYYQATIHAALGEHEQALTLLEQARHTYAHGMLN